METMREAIADRLTRDQRASMDRAEIVRFHEATGLLQSRTWLHGAAAAVRFVFDDYEHRDKAPLRRVIEIERVLWPFNAARDQALIAWRDIDVESCERSIISGRVVREIIGQAYGWGFPVRGMFVRVVPGVLKFLSLPEGYGQR